MSESEIIIITAARPGLWFRERLTPSAFRRWLEEKFVEDYGKTMIKLRQVDDAIYEWVQDIETLSKQLKERRKLPGVMDDRRMIDLAILLGEINKRFKKINEARSILENMNEKYLRRFEESYALEVPESGIAYELSSREKREIEKLKKDVEASDDNLFATASFWDDLKRKWISKKLETEDKKKRRQVMTNLSQKAERLTKSLKTKLKYLSKSRASGDIGEYINTLAQIGKEQQDFESDFANTYSEYLRGPVEKLLAEQNKDLSIIEDPITIRRHPEEPITHKIDPVSEIHPEDEDVEIVSEPKIFPQQPFGLVPSVKPVSTQRKWPPQIIETTLSEPAREWYPPAERQVDLYDIPETEPEIDPITKSSPGMVTEFPITEKEPKTKPEEITTGFGTFRSGPPQVYIEALLDKILLKELNKTSDGSQIINILLKFSQKFENINSNKSNRLLVLAEEMLYD